MNNNSAERVALVTGESGGRTTKTWLISALFGVPTPEIVRGIYDRRLKEWAACVVAGR